MNKAELVSHVAAETSTTKATAERMVGAVFSAIANALARDEPVAIANPPSQAAPRESPNREVGRRTGVEGAVVQTGENPLRRGQRRP